VLSTLNNIGLSVLLSILFSDTLGKLLDEAEAYETLVESRAMPVGKVPRIWPSRVLSLPGGDGPTILESSRMERKCVAVMDQQPLVPVRRVGNIQMLLAGKCR
jgi:hypothetical protein